MKTISKTLDDASTTTKRLQAGADISGQQASRRETPFESRVDFDKLEEVYMNVPVIFNAINKNTQTIMSRNRTIEGSNADFYNNWIDRVGEVGGSKHWDEILESVFRYQQIYGEAYLELIRDKNSGNVVDVVGIDPKSIEYAKAGDQVPGSSIATDEFGNPMGYVQRVPRSFRTEDQVYDVPDEVALPADGLYIPAENMAHFKMFTVGEGFFPLGLIEPAFHDAERAHKLKEDYGDKAHSTLFPTRVARVGDERHEPTPEQISSFLNDLRNAESRTEFAHPYYHEIDILEPEQPEVLIDFFNHFNEELVTSSGTPDAFATGEGGNVNRATLQAQDKMFQISLTDLINRTVRTIQKDIFSPIAEDQGFDETPEYNWDTEIKIAKKQPGP